MSLSCAKAFFQRFCVEEFQMERTSLGAVFSSHLLPSLGARINQATKLSKHIISPFSPRYRLWSLPWLICSWIASPRIFGFQFSRSWFQGLGNAADCSGHLLCLDLPIRVRVSAIQAGWAFHRGQHCQWLLRHWYRSHLFCSISWQRNLSPHRRCQENRNQVSVQSLYYPLHFFSCLLAG